MHETTIVEVTETFEGNNPIATRHVKLRDGRVVPFPKGIHGLNILGLTYDEATALYRQQSSRSRFSL